MYSPLSKGGRCNVVPRREWWTDRVTCNAALYGRRNYDSTPSLKGCKTIAVGKQGGFASEATPTDGHVENRFNPERVVQNITVLMHVNILSHYERILRPLQGRPIGVHSIPVAASTCGGLATGYYLSGLQPEPRHTGGPILFICWCVNPFSH